MSLKVKITNGVQSLKEGDTATEIKMLLLEGDGTVYDFTGKNAKFVVSNRNGKLFERPVVTSNKIGEVIFSFLSGEVTGSGQIFLEIHVQDLLKTRIFPSSDYLVISVDKNLNIIGQTITSFQFENLKTDLSQELGFEIASVQGQINQLVVDGESSPEAAQARVGVTGMVYDTLKERIDDEVKEVTEKTDKLSTDKANVSYVDTVVQSIAGGSPKAVYATLAALQAAKPTGDSNIYLVTADGKWYYWNGTAWTAGGIYQATAIGDGSITTPKIAQESVSPDKTSFFKPLLNLFDKTKISQGYDILASTGELVPSATYFASDFIPVIPGEVYKLKNFGGGEEYTNFAFYTQSKAFVQRVQEYLPFTIPNNVYFIRFSTPEDKNVITFSLNSNVSTSYQPYGKAYINPAVLNGIKSENLEDGAITPKKTVFFGESYNLFNLATALDNYDISNSTGELVASTGYFSSDYIAISPNAVYKLKNFLSQNEYSSFAFYTQNKTFIQRIQEWRTFTAPSNAYYMRFASTENKNGITVSLASNIPVQYVPYDTRKIKPELLPLIADNRFKTLKWNSLGDSITEANKYQTFVNQKLDFATVRNYGIGGTCLAVKADESNLTTAFVRRYTQMDDDADIITVMGGTNDFGLSIPLGNENVKDEKTVLGAMAIIIEGLIAKYPGKYIIWATLPQRNNGFETDGKNNNGETTADFAEGIKRTCRKYAIPCIDIHNESGINKFNMNTNGSLMPDRVHPSDAGYKRLAALFVNTLDKVVF